MWPGFGQFTLIQYNTICALTLSGHTVLLSRSAGRVSHFRSTGQNLLCPLTFLSPPPTSTIGHFGERFHDVQYSLVSSVFSVLILTVHLCAAICKSGGHPCPRVLWSRGHWSRRRSQTALAGVLEAMAGQGYVAAWFVVVGLTQIILARVIAFRENQTPPDKTRTCQLGQ